MKLSFSAYIGILSAVFVLTLMIYSHSTMAQYGDPGPPPVPDTPEAPGPGEINDPALSRDSVISEPDPVVEQPEPLVEQGDPLVEQPDPLVEQPEPLVEQSDPLVEQGEPIGDIEAEGREIR